MPVPHRSTAQKQHKTALLTLGRLPKGLDVARALNSTGYRVIVAEPFPWHLCRMSRAVAHSIPVTAPVTDPVAYRSELLGIIERYNVSLIVPVSEETMHAAGIADHLPKGVRFFGPSQARLLQLHSKWHFIREAASYGLTVPETHCLGSKAAQELLERDDTIVKPVNSCAGRDVVPVARGTSLPDHAHGPERIVQRRLTGAALCTFTIAHEGRCLQTVAYRPLLTSGSVAVAFERLDPLPPALESWVTTFVRKANHSGFIAFDFLDDETGTPHAIECNPRLTSGVHFLTERSLAAAICTPDSRSALELRPQRRLQLFYSTLTEAQVAGFRDRPRLTHALSTLLKTRDVTFRWSDPLPFLTMTATSWRIIRKAMATGKPFGEVATLDIDWHDEAAQPAPNTGHDLAMTG